MTKRYVTYILLLSTWLLPLSAQIVHPYGVEQLLMTTDDYLVGTSRFVALSGAMTAIGGDPSAVKQNPAGLGIYRHSQFSISAESMFLQFGQQNVDKGQLYNRWRLSQLSYVFAWTHPERVAGVVSNNLMISYANRAEVMRNVTLNNSSYRPADASSWIETRLDESGYRHDADLHYAMNISNRVYWGLGMTVEWLQLRQTTDRWEYAAESRRGYKQTYEWVQTDIGRSVGWGASAGVLVHPIQMLRVGLSVGSPIMGRMRETYYYTENISSPSSTLTAVQYSSPDYNSSWQMFTPVKASAGVGLQWKNHGLLSMQYDMQYHKLTGMYHTARAGLEVAVSNHWLIEGGYAYSTLFARQRASAGFNYMGRWLRVGVAYAFSWYQTNVIDCLYNTSRGVSTGLENRVVLTFQWNS